MAPKYHPAPLSGGDRLSSYFDKARAMTTSWPRSWRLLALSEHDPGSCHGILLFGRNAQMEQQF
jgi:hypothetical protein